MMQLLAHRGYWKTVQEKNALSTMTLAFQHQWGVETDIRDYKQQLVISHDIASETSYPLTELLQTYREEKSTACLALNIKADGLSDELLEQLQQENIRHYFVFDMSVPETLRYLRLGLKVFTRISEYESPNPYLFEHSEGIWLDAFTGTWYSAELVNNLLQKGKKVAIVSAELHGRSNEEQWAFIHENNWHLSEHVYLCTDLPQEAVLFFNQHD